MSSSVKDNYVVTPPDKIVDCLPVETKIQLLPFNKLTWENFERFCYRLAKYNNDVEHYDTYGRQGQSQHGLDIYLRRSDGQYDAWQCKRYQKINCSDIISVVSVFLTGKWRKKPTHYAS